LTDLHIAIFDTKFKRSPESWLLNPLVDTKIRDLVARGGKCVVELRSERDHHLPTQDAIPNNAALPFHMFNEIEGKEPFKTLPFTIVRRAYSSEGHQLQLTPARLFANPGPPIRRRTRELNPFRYVYNIGKNAWLRVTR